MNAIYETTEFRPASVLLDASLAAGCGFDNDDDEDYGKGYD
jgi:hypothetical protein